VLVIRAEDDSAGPLFVCYDGSPEAKRAIAAAGDLLAERETIVASFLPPFDDFAMLRKTLPWPASSETEDHLARIDQGEAEFLTERTNDGVELATRAGLVARPLGIGSPGVAWDRLLAAAGTASPSCIVIGHRSNIARVDSTAVEVVHHAERPVLVVPRSG
jgi:nucleotide-binding universal stress UspA family protein